MRNEPSRTAEAVALFRASDQRRDRDTRIVDDPYARHFLSPLSKAALGTWGAAGRLGDLAESFSSGLVAYVLARHRFLDEQLLFALTEGVEQVVILGAGYDTRAYRFHEALAGRPVFELDFPSTASRKASLVARLGAELPSACVTSIPIDFQTASIDDALAGSAFRVGAPTCFVWEGVSMYLTRSAVQATLQTLQRLGGPGSHVGMDFWFLVDQPDLAAAALRMAPQLLQFLGEPITFGIHPEDAPGFLERLGWQARTLLDAHALESSYVRDDRRVYPACNVVDAVRS